MAIRFSVAPTNRGVIPTFAGGQLEKNISHDDFGIVSPNWPDVKWFLQEFYRKENEDN
jgi:hypothetical protein